MYGGIKSYGRGRFERAAQLYVGLKMNARSHRSPWHTDKDLLYRLRSTLRGIRVVMAVMDEPPHHTGQLPAKRFHV
jgi:hypothetical protein